MWVNLIFLSGICELPVSSQPYNNTIPPGLLLAGDDVGIPQIIMPGINLKQLLAEDASDEASGAKPYRFGYDFPVEINPGNSGRWINLKKKFRLWQVRISCPDAYSVNLLFHEFDLKDGCAVWMYGMDGLTVFGPYSSGNNYDHKNVATGIVKGSSVIVELLIPYNLNDFGTFNIARVTHGYKKLPFLYSEKDFNDSGPCNINVNCPAGADWQNEKRAVAVIVDGGRLCTGALVNNTLQDGTPYFLSANHCYGSVGSWAFMFNYESPNCTNIDGPVNQYVSGSVLRAKNGDSDFLLVEMSSPPPAGFASYYLGWDNSGNQPDSQVCIHHPNGDIKKITFDNDPATATTWNSAEVWEIGSWENGTTEPGSSGSPLFDQNHRVIGQLYGGTASCSSLTDDNFGRFDVSWDNGSTPATRLREWLDPNNSGALTMDGFDPNVAGDTIDAGISSVTSPGGSYCNVDSFPLIVTIRNFGYDTLFSVIINYTVDSVNTYSYYWYGALPTLTNETIIIDTLILPAGNHTVDIVTSQPNGSADEDSSNNSLTISFVAKVGPVVEIIVRTDDYGSETFWILEDSAGNNIATGGPYSDGLQQLISTEVCITYGCFPFTVYDSFGDGMCCAYGNGGFWVLNENNDTLTSGGVFTNSVSSVICVNPLSPVAQFIADYSSLCLNGSVQFFSQSTGNPDTWNWIFEEGNPPFSNFENPVVYYDTSGQWDVTLVVTNANGSDTLYSPNFVYIDTCLVTADFRGPGPLVTIYPNPFSEWAEIRVNYHTMRNPVLEVFDLPGRMVKRYGLEDGKSLKLSSIGLAEGIYQYKLFIPGNNDKVVGIFVIVK